MALSFTPSKPLGDTAGTRRRVLVTGAAGNIGSYFAEHSHARYGMRLMVLPKEDAGKVEALRKFGEVVTGDIDDLPRMKELCRGVDTVLHLAASASPDSTWEQL